MAFNIFKSKKTADTVYYNGKIHAGYTFSHVVDAVAVKEGKVIAVGDFNMMEELVDTNTFLYDLKGKYVFPGFIETIERPVMDTLFKEYIHLDKDMNAEDVKDGIENVLYEYDDNEVVFGYGYGDKTFEGFNRNEITSKMDEVETSKPLLIVHDNCLTCAYNSLADKIIKEAAEEEAVRVITLPYILNLLLPFDYETVLDEVEKVNDEYPERGITTVYNWGSPNFFDEVFENAVLSILNEGVLKVKHQGTLMISSKINSKLLGHLLSQLRAKCTEVSEYMMHEILYIELNESIGENDLAEIIECAVELNIKIHISCHCDEEVAMVYKVAEKVSMRGNSEFIFIFTEEETDISEHQKEYANSEYIRYIGKRCKSRRELFEKSKDTGEVIKQLTEIAASYLGLDELLGIIEEGFIADFSIFDRNPLEMAPAKFYKESAAMTVINGEIVYDEAREADDELYQMLSTSPL
ncbi:MAG: amidohydrolase family protein [Clostridiales bacterium]|nr:amidohydrolase family protein [Clostridiales bacterium]